MTSGRESAAGPASPSLIVALDGTTDLPPRKIAALTTYLEMGAPPVGPRGPPRRDLAFDPVVDPDLDWYRALFRRVGERWLWFSRLALSDAELRHVLHRLETELYVVMRGTDEIGLVELDRDPSGDVEIVFLGLVGEAIGFGVGGWLMDQALRVAWGPGTRRVWLHTCTFDHSRALAFYCTAGFRPYKLALEIADDPRLTGVLARDAAPHVPLVETG